MVLIGLGVGWHFVSSYSGRWIGSEWTDSRMERLAEETVTTARQAELAGLRLVDPRDLDRTMERLATGETAKRGPFAGQRYVVRDLAEAGVRERLKSYLKLEEGRLAPLSEEERRLR